MFFDLPTRTTPSLIVGIGSAEGGLDALKALFIALDDSAGMSFIVLQHDVSGSERLPELLRQISDLPVVVIRDGDTLEPDHVFVVPASFSVELRSSTFVLSRPSEPSARRKPIDALFCSIASMFAERAVGVVLSGASNDGSVGVQMIARASGLTLAQDPASARAPAMPQHAIASQVIDRVLSPFQMADALLEHAVHRSEPATPATQETPVELARALHDLQLEKRELERFNQELLSIHGKLHATIEQIRSSMADIQARHEALATAHANLSSLMVDAPIAIILLDAELRVVGFTPDSTAIYDLRASDVGTPLSMIGHRAHDMPPLPALHELRHGRCLPDADVVTRDRWYLRRTLSRHANHGELDGMVVAFVDVTRLKSSEAAANPHEQWLRSITDSMPAIISLVDDALHCY